MGRRFLMAAVFFVAAAVTTGLLGKWIPSALSPLSALSLAGLGALLIGLAPPSHPAAEAKAQSPLKLDVPGAEKAEVE